MLILIIPQMHDNFGVTMNVKIYTFNKLNLILNKRDFFKKDMFLLFNFITLFRLSFKESNECLNGYGHESPQEPNAFLHSAVPYLILNPYIWYLY